LVYKLKTLQKKLEEKVKLEKALGGVSTTGVGAIKKRINTNGDIDTFKKYSNEIQPYILVLKN
jgi:CRISPR/Cas system CSM-associated protein Csm4 (group 5 of RAMP superfamily)